MAEKVDTENEKKGLVYEAFVKLAYLKVRSKKLLWEIDIPGVIANQDFVYPNIKTPRLVIAVTHWGSHEAANKKFWRTLEDRFEVSDKYPAARFLSVLFEMPKDSDVALDELIRIACNGRALSHRNSRVVEKLQSYVDSDEKVRSFGVGKENVYLSTESLFDSDRDFRAAIMQLGRELVRLEEKVDAKYDFVKPLLAAVRRNAQKRTGLAYISSFKSTFYKIGLISTLFFTIKEIELVVNAIKTSNWKSVPKSLKSRLEAMRLIKIVTIARKVVPSKELISFANMDLNEYKNVRSQFMRCIDDPDSSMRFCKDHFCDLVDVRRRSTLLEYLRTAESVDDLLKVETGVGEYKTNRVWVIDYFCAIKRHFTHAKEYGIRKLSNELGFEYKGGGVSSPIPVYSSGKLGRITLAEKNKLYKYILKEKALFDWGRVSDSLIANDRITTMKKKFDVIELLITNALKRNGVSNVERQVSVKNPLSAKWVNAGAGITVYNFVVSDAARIVLLFVVASYEATHKHKELSGRVRLSDVSPQFATSEHKNIIILDGTVFESEPKAKLLMISKAGWDGVYYVDELDDMAAAVRAYLNGERDDISPIVEHTTRNSSAKGLKKDYEEEELREAAEGTKGYGKKKV